MEFECCVTCTTSMTPKPVHHDRMLERSIKIEATSRENMCKDDVGKVVMDGDVMTMKLIVGDVTCTRIYRRIHE